MCANCGSAVNSIRYDFGAQQILRCHGCALLFIHPWPDEEETRAVYGETYFENEKFMDGSPEGLFGYVDYVAERFNNLAPGAVRDSKRLIREPQRDAVKAAITREAEVFGARLRSPEAMEAFQAFFQKRAPDFSKFE